MNDVLFTVIQCVVLVLSVIMSRYLIPLAKTKLMQNQHEEICNIVIEGVRGVEQVIGGGKGKEKKEKVIEYVLSYVHNRGINITSEQIDLLIESAVFAMNGGKKK